VENLTHTTSRAENVADFRRRDESDDALFYAQDRFVSHLDATALETVEDLLGRLINGERPVILDLMAGWDSHLPPDLEPERVVGLGLNRNELAANRSLDSYIIHDLNRDPGLPFADAQFDAVICTVSVDYLTRPVEVFREVGRILRPGGLFVVIFSNRWFEPKVTEVWRRTAEVERVYLVQEWLRAAECFGPGEVFVSKGKPRPPDDRFFVPGLPSDPIYAVYARRGRAVRSGESVENWAEPAALRADDRGDTIRAVKENLECPYCGQRMRKWAVPQTPFTEWDNEFMYICFNDDCPYLVRGWEVMARQGNVGISYRLMYNPEAECLMPVAVPSPGALKEGIID
jgi:SAM-dependent methyltransferase